MLKLKKDFGILIVKKLFCSYPDKEVGQFPMAYVVRKAGTQLSESEVMKFVGNQVR